MGVQMLMGNDERPPFDYILARVETLVSDEGFFLRRYARGEADILKDHISETKDSTVRGLAGQRSALIWDGDRVVGYSGPPIAEGLNVFILAVTPLELKEFISYQPTD